MELRARLKAYLAVSRISFRNIREYTINFFTNFAYFPAELLALFFVYSVVYIQSWLNTGNTTIGGFTLTQLVSYLFLSILLQQVLPRHQMGVQIERDINKGHLVGYLSKPINYSGYRFFSELPRSLIRLAIGAITYIIGMFLILLPAPSLHNVLLFIPVFFSAYIIAFFFVFTLSLATFWVSRQWWLRNFVNLIMMIAGGALIPLTFFPPALHLLLTLLPFQYIYFVPVIVLQGFYHPSQLIGLLFPSLLWILILWASALIVWNLGRRRYEGAGG
jgi:ABC-2 type transport system permease protein